MRYILTIFILLSSAFGLMAQWPGAEHDESKWNNPDYQQAHQLAKTYIERLAAKDFEGAERMLPPIEKKKGVSKSEARKARVADLQSRYADHSKFGPCTGSKFSYMLKGTLPDYPDSQIFFAVVYRYTYEEKKDGKSYSIFIKQDGGSYTIHGY